MTLEQELALFLEEFATRYTSPEAILALSKTFQSHNITIEDWNSLIKFLESNDISINSLYSFIETLVPEVTNKVSKTGDEDVAGFKNFTTGLKISGGGETVTFTVIRNTADDPELVISDVDYVRCQAHAIFDTVTCNLLNPTYLGTEENNNRVYVYEDFTFRTHDDVNGQASYGVKIPNTSNWTQNKTLATTEDVDNHLNKYLFIPDNVSIESYFKAYTSIGSIPTAGDLEYFEPDDAHTFTLKFVPTAIGSNESGFYTMVDPDVAFKLLYEDLGYTPDGITNNVMAVYTPTKYTPYGPSTLILFRSPSGKFWSFLGDL